MPVEIDLTKLCPALSDPNNLVEDMRYTGEIDPNTSSHEVVVCSTGTIPVEVELVSDRYAEKVDTIEIRCKGCKVLEEGFIRQIKKRRQT